MTSVLTSQKRKYAMLHTRMLCGLKRPIRIHFAAIGNSPVPTNRPPPSTAARM